MPGSDRPCPAPVMHETIARAVRDGRILGGPERIGASARRIDASLASFGAPSRA